MKEKRTVFLELKIHGLSRFCVGVGTICTLLCAFSCCISSPSCQNDWGERPADRLDIDKSGDIRLNLIGWEKTPSF